MEKLKSPGKKIMTWIKEKSVRIWNWIKHKPVQTETETKDKPARAKAEAEESDTRAKAFRMLPYVLVLVIAVLLAVVFGFVAYRAMSRRSVQAPVTTPLPTQSTAPTPRRTAAPTPEPSPTPTPSGLCGGRYDVFTEGEIIQTETSYQTKDVAVFFREVREDKNEFTGKKLVYYVADIYVQDIENLRCHLAKDKLNGTYTMNKMSNQANAAVAISGDFAAYRQKGICVRNGKVYRTSVDVDRDVGVLYRDGSFGTFEIGLYTEDDILPRDPWHVWTFGPELLDENGMHKEWFNTDVFTRNPRAVFGYYEAGHYCFVMVRGRTSVSAGMNLTELAQLMEQLGCRSAFNLDGGATAQFYWNGEIYAASSSHRNVNDIVYVPLNGAGIE